jgi:ATP-binding cassette subfamily B protein
MYKPTSGRIEIDGIPIEKINLKSLRSGISLVPQEALLFSDTISNNIAFGSKEELTQQTIEAVAEKAAIHDNIKGFPKGYQTIVGERGVTLSGGQKQRISIARALIRPSSILIFDDCLSAVDNETEEKILASIKKEGVKKTTITISHRISSIQHVDKIIVLNNGQIAEMGTHKNLFEKRGIYFEMYQQQLSK